MLMKRIYGSDGKLDYVELRHTGTGEAQNFSRKLVEAGTAEGWILFEGGKLTLKVKPEALVYTVKRTPGYYCLHCNEKLVSDVLGTEARAHVAAKHAGASASPDKAWPMGYLVTHAYECTLDPKQHEKFKALPMGAKRGSK